VPVPLRGHRPTCVQHLGLPAEKFKTMRKAPSHTVLAFTFLGLCGVACSTAVEPGDDGGSTGGSSGAPTGGTSGASPTGGSTATGGTAMGGTNTGGSSGAVTTGGTSTGGSIGTGGSSGSGGAGGSIGGAGQSGSGGSVTGGSGGAGTGGGGAGGVGGGSAGKAGSGGSGSGGKGGSGGSGGGAPVDPSPGCGKGGRPANGDVNVANVSRYMFPTSYNGTTPFPLLIALHACGNPNSQFVSMTNNTGFATEYVRSFPNTPDSGQCWSNYNNGVARIKQQYDEVMNAYCIDRNRVFGTGHSSGAQMLVQILARSADAQYLKLKGVAPVAADPYNVAVPIPVMLIQSPDDNQRGSGSAANTIARFRTSNMCQSTSMPYTPVMGCNSSDGGGAVNPGCVSYAGCSVPTIWCSHDDPSYSGTHHGVPCFAIKAMYDFFATLR
jgi:polyhydroxybutyrate depolymerase